MQQREERGEEKVRNLCKDMKVAVAYFGAVLLNRKNEQFSGSATQIADSVMRILDALKSGHKSFADRWVGWLFGWLLLGRNNAAAINHSRGEKRGRNET